MEQEGGEKESDLVRIWKELKGARQVHPVGLGYLFFQYLISGLMGNPMGSLATLLLLLLAVLLAGIFFVVSSPLTVLVMGQGSHVPVKVYFNTTVEEGQAEAKGARTLKLIQEMQGMQEVRSVDFVSGEDALKELQRELGEQHPIFRSLDAGEQANEQSVLKGILPDRLHVFPRAGSEQGEFVRLLEARLKGRDDIKEIRFESKLVATLRQFSELLGRLGTLLAIGIFSAAFLLVIVSMQLRYILRADEVGVMRLVGATFPFIVAPLYLEAALLGLIAGVLGLAAVWFFQSSLLSQVFEVFPHLAEHGATLTLGLLPLFALLVAPLVVAIFGTWLATRLLRDER